MRLSRIQIRVVGIRDKKDTPESESGFWKQLNSPFVIWLLTSVVIAIATWAFGKYTELREEKARAERLNMEIEYRIGQLMAAIRPEKDRDDINEAYNRFVTVPTEPFTHYLFLENSNRNLMSLLFEIKMLTKNDSISRPMTFILNYKVPDDSTGEKFTVSKFETDFNGSFALKQWNHNLFNAEP